MVVFRRPVIGVQARGVPANLQSHQAEIKALDNSVATITFNSTASIQVLNLIRTGSTFCNRIGRKVEMTSIRIVGTMAVKQQSNAPNYCRLLVIYDRQTNGALPAIADILQSTIQDASNSTTSFSGLNLNNRDRFQVLRDLRIALPPVTDNETNILNPGLLDQVTTTSNIDLYVKLPNLVTQYKADSVPAVIGDIATGSLLLVTLSNLPVGSEGYTSLLETRLRFKDL